MSRTTDVARRDRLLYLSLNDGSDTRINKEIVTLAQAFTIDFVGVGEGKSHPFISPHIRRLEVVKGSRRSLFTLARLAGRVLRLLATNRYDSVHVINENLYLLLWPLLLGQRVVLDVFDSIFLKSTLPGGLLRLGARFCYALPAKIIVTDDERASLMPAPIYPKLVILPNYPFRYTGPVNCRDSQLIRILYAGWLGLDRGTSLLQALLAAGDDVRVVMAGWIPPGDEPTRTLAAHPRVEWLGVVPQQQIIGHATRCDFILCHYPPKNVNNIYASPNKIYDAIQAGIAVIINPEVRVARFVREHGLGVVLDAYAPKNLSAVVQSLREFKAAYQPDPALRERYLWEAVEGRLLAAHQANLPVHV